MADNEDQKPEANLDSDEYLPMKRDYGFLVKLVGALLVGIVAAGFVGWKIRSAAAGCGAGLVRPGSSVVPPSSEPNASPR